MKLTIGNLVMSMIEENTAESLLVAKVNKMLLLLLLMMIMMMMMTTIVSLLY